MTAAELRNSLTGTMPDKDIDALIQRMGLNLPLPKPPTGFGVVDDRGIEFSPSQQRALDMIMDAVHSRRPSFTFVTGKAGTGKSTVLREIRKRARCLVCAPTGLAAVNVKGDTVHRLFGLRIGPMTKGKTRDLENKRRLFKTADCIVIDEVSMVRADLMDAINWTCQKTIGNDLPFGGIPIVAFGDMFQLEPVVKDDERDWMKRTYKSHFWFDAKVLRVEKNLIDFEPSIDVNFAELTDVFRQIGDPDFIDALNATRIGCDSGLTFLNKRANVAMPVGELPVILTFGNKKAASMNEMRLAQLHGDSKVFTATITGNYPADAMVVPMELELKIGAQVMVCKNIQDDMGGLVSNGAIGEVVSFVGEGAEVLLRDGRQVVVNQETWESISYEIDKDEDIKESIDGELKQLPLKLAWSMTTHKAQGQTLDSAVLELEMKAFAHGQLYVALSRVKRFDGLYLKRRLSPRDLVIHDRVLEFAGIKQELQLNLEALSA